MRVQSAITGVAEDADAPFAWRAPRVEQPEQPEREERHEQGTEHALGDDRANRFIEEEQRNRWNGQPEK